MVKIEKSQCLSSRGPPGLSKTHLTFILRPIFDGVMAVSNIEAFFLGHPVYKKNCHIMLGYAKVLNSKFNIVPAMESSIFYKSLYNLILNIDC